MGKRSIVIAEGGWVEEESPYIICKGKVICLSFCPSVQKLPDLVIWVSDGLYYGNIMLVCVEYVL